MAATAHTWTYIGSSGLPETIHPALENLGVILLAALVSKPARDYDYRNDWNSKTEYPWCVNPRLPGLSAEQ